jgi:hypothetical protein
MENRAVSPGTRRPRSEKRTPRVVPAAGKSERSGEIMLCKWAGLRFEALQYVSRELRNNKAHVWLTLFLSSIYRLANRAHLRIDA